MFREYYGGLLGCNKRVHNKANSDPYRQCCVFKQVIWSLYRVMPVSCHIMAT